MSSPRLIKRWRSNHSYESRQDHLSHRRGPDHLHRLRRARRCGHPGRPGDGRRGCAGLLLVATDYQDAVFEAVYRAGELNSPGAGLAHITPIEKMAIYIPREIRERIPGQGASA